MTTSKLNRFWTVITVFLIAVIAIGGIVAWSRYSPCQAIEISLPTSAEGEVCEVRGVYIGGAVGNPGFHQLESGESVEALIEAAGGTTEDADLTGLRLYIPSVGEGEKPQKIDINRAEAWLLEALPGIGESKAQAIIAYRQQNGGFRNITEITEVAGIGPDIYDQIKNLITVAD
jgi:competence protein ComEA